MPTVATARTSLLKRKLLPGDHSYSAARADAWTRRKDQWLPSKQDGDFIAQLMKPMREPGRFAGWIAAPKVGIDNKPGDFEYVKVAA